MKETFPFRNCELIEKRETIKIRGNVYDQGMEKYFTLGRKEGEKREGDSHRVKRPKISERQGKEWRTMTMWRNLDDWGRKDIYTISHNQSIINCTLSDSQ